MPDPISVVRDLIDTVNRRELDEAMVFLDDDVKVRIEPLLPGSSVETYTGKKFVQRFWQDLLDEHLTLEARNLEASGNEVTWDSTLSVDRLAAMGVETVQARGHAVVEEGRIDSFTLTLTPESASRVREAMARQAQPT
ncbi:MAG: nuclear transport factor 2 family protein [Anaerolineae bacterium]|nr:nuclear transport factor 2 family protein [Anaerolineae bacterium]